MQLSWIICLISGQCLCLVTIQSDHLLNAFLHTDMVAVPDFSAGAMENWGLIIYRETALLFEPQISSAGNQQSVAVVVSHELAHQV